MYISAQQVDVLRYRRLIKKFFLFLAKEKKMLISQHLFLWQYIYTWDQSRNLIGQKHF